jgi:DNA-binding transcriptional LysR family regulator
MELKNILTFLRIAELGSFTKSANELGYSQSTVTVQIRQLENELGGFLFNRIGKKVSLTPMGEEFVVYAREMLNITSKIRNMTKAPSLQRGTLRLGILESLLIWKLSDLIPAFHHEWPLMNIEIKTSNGAELYQMLRQNELDMIYVLGQRIYRKDCVRAFENPEKVTFVSAADNPLAKEDRLSLPEVVRQPLILVERTATYRRALEERAAQMGIEILPLLEISDIVTILKLLGRFDGVSFLPEYCIREDFKEKRLSMLNVEDFDIRLWSQVVYHKNKWVTPQMELLTKLIRESSK